MKRIINLIILFSGISFIYIVLNNIIKFKCIFKNLFNIRCPGCGLTRSFKAILDLDFSSSLHYNILGIPLFITLIVIVVSLIIDIITNKDRTIKFVNNILKKNYIIIIILLIITTVINNIHSI